MHNLLYSQRTTLLLSGLVGILTIVLFVLFANRQSEVAKLGNENKTLISSLEVSNSKNASLSAQVAQMLSEDPRKTNELLRSSVSAVNKVFSSYSNLLDKISDAKGQKIDVSKQEAQLPTIVNLLANLKWQEAQQQINIVSSQLDQSQTAVVAQISAPASNSLPGDGYSRQSVSTDKGTFVVDLIAADLANTRILTDVGSDGDCANNCTVMPLAGYVARNGGFAGINGSYFCPPDYASCAGKVNSFDTLAFNSRTKTYSNSDNNKYSTVPMFVQTSDHSFRLMGQSLEWGRDTGIIGGLANYPILVSGGHAATGDDSKGGPKGFIGTKGGKVYIGHVQNATYGQAAKVLETLGLDQALNLDGGGSSALWFGGYKVGPGRSLPNAVILAH